MDTAPQTRQIIAQRALDRAASRGVSLESDETFMALLAHWIQGDIPMRVMRNRYFEAVAQKKRILRNCCPVGDVTWAKDGEPDISGA
jgi:hypothetical protein